MSTNIFSNSLLLRISRILCKLNDKLATEEVEVNKMAMFLASFTKRNGILCKIFAKNVKAEKIWGDVMKAGKNEEEEETSNSFAAIFFSFSKTE